MRRAAGDAPCLLQHGGWNVTLTCVGVFPQAKFVNGKPDRIEARYIMRSTLEWDRFMVRHAAMLQYLQGMWQACPGGLAASGTKRSA